jgi:ADP-ribose pyrophosphatase YjhB (NUDIX family)
MGMSFQLTGQAEVTDPNRIVEPAGEAPGLPRIAGVVLLRHDGAALMQLRDDKPGLSHAGKWVPPGGHCEPDESLEACARREFREETDYECAELHRLMATVAGPADGCAASRQTFFWACYDGVQPVRCLEGQAVQFIERQRAAAYPIPAYLLEVWDRAITAANAHPRGLMRRRVRRARKRRDL